MSVKRSLARSGLLGFTAVFVALVTFCVTVLAGFFAAEENATVQDHLRRGPATHAAFQLESGAVGAEAQRVAALVDESLATEFAPESIRVWRSTRTALRASTTAGPVGIIAGSEPSLAERATLVAGQWPAGSSAADTPIPVAVQARAAAALGLAPGDTLTAGTGAAAVRLQVAGTWLPRDAQDPAWFGDSAVASGFSGTDAGPFLTTASELSALPGQLSHRWTAVPVADRVRPQDVNELAAGLAALSDSLNRPNFPATMSGQLDERLASMQQALSAARGVAAVPAAVILAVIAITMAQLARLLVTVRAHETRLLRVRGASAARLAATATMEAAVVAIVPAAAAALAAHTVLSVADRRSVAWLWLLPTAIALLTIMVFGLTALRAVFAKPGQRRGESDSRAARGSLALLAIVATTVSLWQFLLYDGALSHTAEGAVTVDPLTAFAPALLLLSLAMTVVLAFGPLASLLERWGARPRGLLPVLPTRQVARRSQLYAAAIVLTVIAIGGATLAAGFTASWSPANAAADHLRNGADVRLDLDVPATAEGTTAVSGEAFSSLPGVDATALVMYRSGAVDGDIVDVIATPGRVTPADDPDTLGVRVTRAFARHFGLGSGDTFSFVVSDSASSATAVVTEITPTLAGTANPLAMGANLDALTSLLRAHAETVPQPNQVWLSTRSPHRVAAAAGAVSRFPLTATTLQTDSAAPYLRTAIAVLRWGAGAAIALAALAILTLSSVLLVTRRHEIAVLRALGVSGRTQVRNRLAELGTVALLACLCGIAAGVAVARLTVPALVRNSIPQLPSAFGIGYRPGFATVGIAVLAFAAAMLAIAALYARRIERSTRGRDTAESIP